MRSHVPKPKERRGLTQGCYRRGLFILATARCVLDRNQPYAHLGVGYSQRHHDLARHATRTGGL